ncbi:MAG: hypothetical protein Fues2KO_06440 [Fuerstiella sp.]
MSIASDKLSPGLGGVPETLLIPLWARAIEQQHADPILIDPAAVEIVDRLDYDFNTFKRQNVAVENFCVRASVIDDVVRSALEQRPGTPVVEFGPGLDTRCDRIGSLASSWLEVDLPEVVRLRRSFFKENDHRRIAAGSMLDGSWHEACADFDRPPLFIAEGVFYFFSVDQIAQLLRDLATRFPGAQFVFDAVSPEFLKLSNWQHPLKDSRLQFSLKPYARELTERAPQWQVDQYVGFGDSPWYDRSMHRFPLWKRMAARWLPWGRHAFMVVQASVCENTQPSS